MGVLGTAGMGELGTAGTGGVRDSRDGGVRDSKDGCHGLGDLGRAKIGLGDFNPL